MSCCGGTANNIINNCLFCFRCFTYIFSSFFPVMHIANLWFVGGVELVGGVRYSKRHNQQLSCLLYMYFCCISDI